MRKLLSLACAAGIVAGAASIASGDLAGSWRMEEIVVGGGVDRFGQPRDAIADELGGDHPLILGRRPTSAFDTVTDVNEPTLTPRGDRPGNALLYDGVDDTSYVRRLWGGLPDGSDPGPDTYFFRFDFRPDAPLAGEQTLLQTVDKFEVRIRQNTGGTHARLWLYVWNPDGSTAQATSDWFHLPGSAPGTWHTAIGQVAPGTDNVRVVVDGAMGGAAVARTYSPGRNIHHDVLYVGSTHAIGGTPSRPYAGAIDELMVGAPQIPGDANLDGVVNIADLGILAANWQQTGVNWFGGDFNQDLRVDIADLGILAANWQQSVDGPSFSEALAMFDAFAGVVVPEPAAAGLLLLGALGVRRRARGRGRA
jgi:hypothetical protein